MDTVPPVRESPEVDWFIDGSTLARTSLATIAPVSGPSVIPSVRWLLATTRFSVSGSLPRTGIPSGVIGATNLFIDWEWYAVESSSHVAAHRLGDGRSSR